MSDNLIGSINPYNFIPVGNANKQQKSENSKTEKKEIHNITDKDNFKNTLISVSKSDPKTILFVDKDSGMTKDSKDVAEKLTSLFENSTFDLKYDYAEHLDDGRGITAGRAGFTTGTGDLYEVVKKYTSEKPNNPLAKYLPRLKVLAETESSSVKGLNGLIENWAKAAKDPDFRKVQDNVVDEMYYKPAMEHVEKLGLKTPVAKAFVYDTIIQHGNGNDADGLPALINQTNKKMHGSPKTGVNEKKWLETFIAVRKSDLAHAHDPETRKVWSESTGRCDAFSSIIKDGNYELNKPVKIHTKEYNEIIK